MPTKSARHALLALAFGLLSPNLVPLQALATETATSLMQVQATVGSACYISVDGEIAFGDIGRNTPKGAAELKTSPVTVNVKCTASGVSTVKLKGNSGTNPDGTVRRIKSSSGSTVVPYGLRVGSDDLPANGKDIAISSKKGSVKLTGYIKITDIPNSLVTGNYGDTVTLSITY